MKVARLTATSVHQRRDIGTAFFPRASRSGGAAGRPTLYVRSMRRTCTLYMYVVQAALYGV